MAYNKRITSEGKDKVLKLAFVDQNDNPFVYCALGIKDGELAASTGDVSDFQEFSGESYHREKITLDKIENNTLYASCIFEDNNYSNMTNAVIGEIGLCDSYDSDNSIFFAFSEVPEIKKTSDVSLKYTWIISIE